MEADKQYRNPTPVAVAIVPVEKTVVFKIDGKTETEIIFHHVLYAKRNIEPKLGSLALPGGFVNENERIETAGKRELFEETGLIIEEHEFQLFQSWITSQNRVLVFGVTPVQKETIIHTLEENLSNHSHIREETQGFHVGGVHIDKPAFPLHQMVIETYLNKFNGHILSLMLSRFGFENAKNLEQALKEQGFLSKNFQY